MTGAVPQCLRELNEAELATVSPNRILTHTVVLQADHHEGIVGWHSMFENKNDVNALNLQYLFDLGLTGEFLCVLVGPWTDIQVKKVKKTYCVRPEKVLSTSSWLKNNNIHFKDFKIPKPEDLPNPRILHHKTLEVTR